MARKVEQEIERLNDLRDASPLRKALGDRVNLIVAKAAKMAAGLQLRELTPDLVAAFDRLFTDAAARDPQCWGKNAIARALVDLDYRESAPFLRGVGHVQMEATYGGRVDTAPALRGICLLALPPCPDLTRADVLRYLVDGLTDEAGTVRVEAVRGLELMEGETALLLRLKARLGDKEPSVIGQVFDSLLHLEGERGIPFVSGFLKADAETRGEAALALGSSRLPAAVGLLRTVWETARETEFRHVILRALGISRQEIALQFLQRVADGDRAADARVAREVLDQFNRKERIEGQT